MNGSDTFNTAEPGSTVGAQVGQMHNSQIYVVGPDEPPEREYEVGCHYLADGVPSKAREHLERARARGFEGPEVLFHQALALLSKRSYRDLTKEDKAVLANLSVRGVSVSRDGWRRGLGVVFTLLSCVDGSNGDTGAAVAELEALPATQRDLILRHLDLVLTGGMKQSVWHRVRENAKEARFSNDRVNRVWAYFEAEPAGPRTEHPKPYSISGRDFFGGLLLAAASLFPVAIMTGSALSQGSLTALLACLTMLVFGPVAGWHVASWHHRHRRRLALAHAYGYGRSPSPPPKGGFAEQVEREFDHYFAKYAPDPLTRNAWSERTKGVRRCLRDEVVRIYRETGVEADQVKWLIRFLVRDVRKRLRTGQPVEPEEIHRVDSALKLRCAVLCLFTAAATTAVVGIALQQAPVSTAGCLLFTVIAARFAVPLWLRIHSERRRFGEESQERKAVDAARKAEYERWRNKLGRLRPHEDEMEAWLSADKTLILEETLMSHRLVWHEIVAHAFLPTPKRPCRSAHVSKGPWRYSRYEIRVFLVTEEGVREATAVLDFSRSRWRTTSRKNYRFDAVSSVQVEIASTRRYTLNITLNNGPSESIVVSEAPNLDAVVDEESQSEAPDINLETAGFSHTLRVLEGIAAEGKPWFGRAVEPPSADPSDPPAAA
ncbi:hypothetical protein GCM10007079_46860 [Nocardiopsis terrae]|uniref:Uncharacterized protein n=1 Tax=Nocardiopsis terrae TaxID=372655 RepID=A0ABR9HKF3_9ACTN|nr:hypothetical protein [Nocardiopsis terrae]MBE1459504.1 hypothetical protein [Nocardiopsis terrae]GHC95303.1 hypothetical protein GCM10007079_46860 [Nocardiopsis terrae]